MKIRVRLPIEIKLIGVGENKGLVTHRNKIDRGW